MERKLLSIKDVAFRSGRTIILGAALATSACSAYNGAEATPEIQPARYEPGKPLTPAQRDARRARIENMCDYLRKPESDGRLPNILLYQGCLIKKSSDYTIE